MTTILRSITGRCIIALVPADPVSDVSLLIEQWTNDPWLKPLLGELMWIIQDELVVPLEGGEMRLRDERDNLVPMTGDAREWGDGKAHAGLKQMMRLESLDG